MTFSDRELMELQIQSLYIHNNEDDITEFNGPPGDEGKAPWVFVARTSESVHIRFHPVVSKAVRQAIIGLVKGDKNCLNFKEKLQSENQIIQILKNEELICDIIWNGPVYSCFKHQLIKSKVIEIHSENIDLCKTTFPNSYYDLHERPPAFAVVEDGLAVAICFCATEPKNKAVEAGVVTHKDFRQKGYGVRVVSAWIDSAIQRGLIPLYSTGWDNIGSMGIADKLGLKLFGSDFHIRQS